MPYSSYKNSAALQGTIVPNMAAPPGEAAGVVWLKNGENAEQTISNRPHKAIADNCDLLKERLDADIAVTQTAALAAFTGNSIDIDPTGGAAGDINFTGTVYLGTGYAVNQENRDTLFQLLDENYNEVMVDGAEVVVSAVGGGAVGGGFYNAGVVTLTLSDTIPTGNYRLRYSIGASLATLPDDALISADIRGVHEAAGESAKPSFIVCAPAGGYGDYIGADAVLDALTAVTTNATIFVKDGTYTINGNVSIGTGVRLVGEARRYSGNGTTLDISNGAVITMNDNSSLENIYAVLSGAVVGTEAITASGDRVSIRDCILDGISLNCSGNYGSFDNIEIVNPTAGLTSLYVSSSNFSTFNNFTISSTTVVVIAGTCSGLTFNSVSIDTTHTGISFNAATVEDSSFRSVSIVTTTSTVISIGTGVFKDTTFENCYFEGEVSLLTTDAVVRERAVTFRNCYFNNVGSAWYKTAAVKMLCHRGSGVAANFATGAMFEDCKIVDKYCTGTTSSGIPGALVADGAGFAVVELEGVSFRNLILDRSTITYNVEDGAWLKMTNCDGTGLTVRTASTAAMAEDVAITGSDGLIEFLEETRVSDVKVILEYEDRVYRPVVYVYNSHDHDEATEGEHCLPATVNGLHIAFDDGTARHVGNDTALGLEMAGNSVVRDFVWNAGNIWAFRNDAGGINLNNSIVLMHGDYNTLENCQIDCDCTVAGSTTHVIYVGSHSDYLDTHNIIRGGKVSMQFGACLDPVGTKYPLHGVYAKGAGTLVEGLSIFTNDTTAATFYPIYATGGFVRVANCFIHMGTCFAGTNAITWSGAVPIATGVAVGNICRASGGVVAPGIAGPPAGLAGNLTIIEATILYPTS